MNNTHTFSFSNLDSNQNTFHGTTILAVKKNNQTVVGGDGQVSMGQTIMKKNAVKVRRISNNSIITGFAGAVADSFTLFELFEKKVEQYQGSLNRAAVELARDWRTDKMLRKLESLLIVADKKELFLISGTGDVISPDDGIIAIGSGGNYALSAARALLKNTEMPARKIVEESLKIAAEICVYTNSSFTIEEIEEIK